MLILTNDGDTIGSGSLLNKRGDILTNWHVVGDAKSVGVVFKPVEGTGDPRKAEPLLVRAKVLKVDKTADLALVRVDQIPANVTPIRLGRAADLSVGDDVHAIGHPQGEIWTYTRGIVSQIRRGYEWSTSSTGPPHRANVIQTQTPINPGNSGGPLLDNNGKLVGVNTFKNRESEGLNFAVSVDEVTRFRSGDLQDSPVSPSSPGRTTSASCPSRTTYQGKSRDGREDVWNIDLNCDGKLDAMIRRPVDGTSPTMLTIDRNTDGKWDVLVLDGNRDDRWDRSYHDTNFDGKWDLECEHADEGVEPTRCRPYKDRSRK